MGCSLHFGPRKGVSVQADGFCPRISIDQGLVTKTAVLFFCLNLFGHSDIYYNFLKLKKFFIYMDGTVQKFNKKEESC